MVKVVEPSVAVGCSRYTTYGPVPRLVQLPEEKFVLSSAL